MRKIKNGSMFNVARQHFMIDSLDDLPDVENAYSCAQGDIAELPTGDIYVKADDSALGWKLMGESGSGGPPSVILQEKEVTITDNGTSTITADMGYDGLEKVDLDVQVDPPVLQAKEIEISTNGTTTVTADGAYDGLSSVEIDVSVNPPVLQNKTINILTNTTTLIEADDGYDGLDQVSVTTQVGVVEEKDVNFIDYDGTLLYSYTKADFANLSEMPANPSHARLTAQGWNWTLADAKTYVAANDRLWIGQSYITSSGATEIDIELTNPDLLSPNLIFYLDGTISVDWGDNTTPDTITFSTIGDIRYKKHTYSTTGKYTISIIIEEGSFILSCPILNDDYNVTERFDYVSVYQSSITDMKYGNNITSIGQNLFTNCYSLKTVTLPNTITAIALEAFKECLSLEAIVLPSSLIQIRNAAFSLCESLQIISFPATITTVETQAFTSCGLKDITLPLFSNEDTNLFGSNKKLKSVKNVKYVPNNTFQSCYLLQDIELSNDITSIGNNGFRDARSLQEITIPASVTSIGTYAFYQCYNLQKIHFKPTIPPTITSSSTFLDLDQNCIIYVPTGYLSAYTGATNYPNPVNYTYVEE